MAAAAGKNTEMVVVVITMFSFVRTFKPSSDIVAVRFVANKYEKIIKSCRTPLILLSP